MSANVPDLRIAALQAELVWSNPVANRAHLGGMLQSVEADVIVLPEMFTTGFNMEPDGVAEDFDLEGSTVQWMRSIAAQKDALLLGSVATQAAGKFYNRMLAVKPDGSVEHYDKRHLFSFAGEHHAYTAGTERLIVQWKGWRLCPLICYDLRFPVWSRNTLENGQAAYDVLLYVANWPAVRVHAWRDLLYARAHENAAYVVGCNRVGSDANGIVYNGQSAIIDMKGARLDELVEGEAVVEAVVSFDALQAFRKKFPVLHDGDGFSLQ